MKFFNIDLHVSVIEDVAMNFQHLGHEVDSHLMSGHYWTLGKPQANRGTGSESKGGKVGYGPINLETWENAFQSKWGSAARMFREACPELDDYDGFVVCYPPSFALLYEQFQGHVLVDVPVRYEQPFTNDLDCWRRFNEYLVRGVEAGKITVLGNSAYESAYYEYFTGQSALHISSTCEYVDRVAPKWAPTEGHFYAFGEHAGCRAAAKVVSSVIFIRDRNPPEYKYEEISQARGIVWIPYNCSIMSFFEHYWLGIPLFVPTQRFVLEMWERGEALSQTTWHASQRDGSRLEGKSGRLDPHTREGLEAWLPLYDFYNEAEFPFVTYFDSWEDLRVKLEETDLYSTSAKMLEHNRKRRARNLAKWASVLKRVEVWRKR